MRGLSRFVSNSDKYKWNIYMTLYVLKLSSDNCNIPELLVHVASRGIVIKNLISTKNINYQALLDTCGSWNPPGYVTWMSAVPYMPTSCHCTKSCMTINEWYWRFKNCFYVYLYKSINFSIWKCLNIYVDSKDPSNQIQIKQTRCQICRVAVFWTHYYHASLNY